MAGETVRASDREREATVLRLRAALLEGRIETDELEERIARAHAARTRGELDAVEADLPERPTAAIGVTTGVPRWPGTKAFNERKLLHAPMDEVREAALAFIVPSLEKAGYTLIEERADVLIFAGGGQRITVRLRDAGGGSTLVLAHGIAPLRVRQAFAKLTD